MHVLEPATIVCDPHMPLAWSKLWDPMIWSEIIALAWAALFVIAVRIICGENSRLKSSALWFVAGSIAMLFAISLSASF